jgi:hypothetical protein
MLYDGMCGFCRRWVPFWAATLGRLDCLGAEQDEQARSLKSSYCRAFLLRSNFNMWRAFTTAALYNACLKHPLD